MANNTEFTHFINVLIGADTPFQLFCIENKFTTYRKLKDRWKDIHTLEYTDSKGTKVKLSDEDINEFMAIVPFKNYLQNDLGLKKYHPLNIKQYSREDFLHYYDDEYDPDSPTQYDQAMALANQRAAEEIARNNEKHEAQMKLRRLSSLPMLLVGLQQSLMALHGNIELDQTAPIISSIGFGQLLHSTPLNYDHNLLSDLEELLNLLGEYNGDKEMLVVLIKMVSDYFLEHKTIISFENPDVILRDLMLRVLHKVTHSKVRDQNNSTILRSSIEQTSRYYHTPRPGINYPNTNDNDRILIPCTNPMRII